MRTVRYCVATLTAVLIAMIACAETTGDVLITKSGKVWEGTVTEEGDNYVLTFPFGDKSYFPKTGVKQVFLAAEYRPKYLKMTETIDLTNTQEILNAMDQGGDWGLHHEAYQLAQRAFQFRKARTGDTIREWWFLAKFCQLLDLGREAEECEDKIRHLEYDQQLKSAKNDAMALAKLAVWCRDKGMTNEEMDTEANVLKLAPDDPDVRKELGYSKDARSGQWVRLKIQVGPLEMKYAAYFVIASYVEPPAVPGFGAWFKDFTPKGWPDTSYMGPRVAVRDIYFWNEKVPGFAFECVTASFTVTEEMELAVLQSLQSALLKPPPIDGVKRLGVELLLESGRRINRYDPIPRPTAEMLSSERNRRGLGASAWTLRAPKEHDYYAKLYACSRSKTESLSKIKSRLEECPKNRGIVVEPMKWVVELPTGNYPGQSDWTAQFCVKAKTDVILLQSLQRDLVEIAFTDYREAQVSLFVFPKADKGDSLPSPPKH